MKGSSELLKCTMFSIAMSWQCGTRGLNPVTIGIVTDELPVYGSVNHGSCQKIELFPLHKTIIEQKNLVTEEYNEAEIYFVL